MNKLTLSVAAMAVIAPVHVQAEELTDAQKAELIAKKKEAIEGLRQKLTQVTNYIQTNCPDVKEEWLLNISYIQKDLENDYNDDKKLDLTDAEKAAYEGRIETAKNNATSAQAPYTTKEDLDDKYATLKNLYDTKVAQCGNGDYPNVGAGKKAALHGVGVEAIGEQINGYDLTKQDIVNDKQSIINKITDATSSINKIMENIDDEEEAIANNESAYKAVQAAYNAAKDVFNKQIQEAIAKLPRPVYENWQNDAIEKLNTLFRTIEAANKSNESLYADKKCPTKMNENINAIKDAQGRIENVVSGYVALMEIEEAAKAVADTKLQSLQSALNTIKAELSKRNLTECDVDINAVQASINQLTKDINDHYANGKNDLSKFNYNGTVTTINSKTSSVGDNNGHGYALVISNYDYYTNTLAPAVKALQTDLDAKRAAAQAAKSEDGLYDAATYYAPYYNTTNDLISKLRNNAENAFKEYTAETFHKGTSYTTDDKKINNNIAQYEKGTADALVAYNNTVAYTKTQQELLDALIAKVTDDAVSLDGSFPVEGETYGDAITKIKDEINAINKKVEEAKKKTNDTHKSYLQTAENMKVSYDIANLTDQYESTKSDYDKNAAINAADAVLSEAQNRIKAFQTLIDGVAGESSDYGNQAENIKAEKKRIQGLLEGVQTTLVKVQGDYDVVKESETATNQDKQNAAAAAIASLADVKGALDEIEPDLKKLNADAEAALTNKAAYDAITSVIAAAQATLDDVMENTVNPQAQSAAYEYYRQQMNQKKSNLDQVTTDTEASYTAIKAAADKESLIARANAIVNDAKYFADAVLENENTFANQWADVENLQSTWTTIYNTISEKDLSDEAKNYLQRLASFQQDINTLKNTTVPVAFAEGNAKAKDDEIQAEIKRIADEIVNICNESNDNYDANVDATNAAQHENFLRTYETANNAFSEAIKTLNKFSAIKNEALQTALDNLIEYHDNIYAYADKLLTLKSNESRDYDKYVADVTDGKDDIYDAQKWVDFANTYYGEITDLILAYQDLVNQAAVKAFTTTIDNATAEVARYDTKITTFTYSGKANAFKDVKDVIAKAKTAGAIDADGTVHDKLYAVNVDTWMVTLDNNLISMLNADLRNACDAEKEKLVKAVTNVYEEEKKAIEKLDEIDNAAYLAQLETLKAGTIDIAVNGYYNYDETGITQVVKPNCDAYYGIDADTKHSDIYTEAYNLSAGKKANLDAYGRMNTTLNGLVADYNNVINKVNTLIVAHQTGSVNTLINQIKKELESKHCDIETWKGEGSCVSNEVVFNSFNSKLNRDGYPQLIDNLKNLTIGDEIIALKAIIDEVKEEYNQAAKENLDAVKEYDAKIQQLYADVAAIKRYNDKGVDKFDEACANLLTQEGKIAKINSELNAMYENSRIAEAVAKVDEAVNGIEPIMAQAEEWADYNDATRNLYQVLVQGLRGEFDLVKADFDTKKENGQILIYKDNILFDLETIKNAVPGYGSELHNEYNKQLDNNNRYQRLNNLLTQAESDLEESYGRIKDFKYRKVSDYGQDLINTTYYDLKWDVNNCRTELEKGYKDVTLAGACDLSDCINKLSSSIVDMEKDATHYEALGLIGAVKGSLKESIDIKYTLNYGGNRAADLQNEYNRIYGLADKAEDYNNDAEDNSISKDINGEDCRIWVDWMGGYSEIGVNYLEEAWPTLQTRIATLQADADKFANDVVELAYILGDADNDKRITVNDYSEVRGWILSATKFEKVSEAKRYGGDVNGDGEFTVADMTGISNLIFHEQWDWTPARVSARMRAAADASDQLTLTSESEETTIFGKTVRMALNVENAETFTAGQLDIMLPQGMKIAAQSLSDRANGHELLANELGNGIVRMVASTVENNAFTGHNGALIYIDVEVGSDYNGGQIAIDNVIFSDAKANSYYLSKNAPILPTGVEGIQAATMKERIYSVGGQMLKAVKKGVNIIKGENGTKKVISNK